MYIYTVYLDKKFEGKNKKRSAELGLTGSLFFTMFGPPQDIEPDFLSLTVLNPLLELKRNRIGDVFVDISSLIRRQTPLCSCSH